MPKKKELLIILILAVLVAGLSWFYVRKVFGLGHSIAGATLRGWPFAFLVWEHTDLPMPFPPSPNYDFEWVLFVIDFLFWSLVLAGSWWGLNFVLKIRIKDERFDVKKKVES